MKRFVPKIANNLLNNLPPEVIAPVVVPHALNSLVVLRDRRPKGFANTLCRASLKGIWLCPPHGWRPTVPVLGFSEKLGCCQKTFSWPFSDTQWLQMWQPGVAAFSGPHVEVTAQIDPFRGLHTSRPAPAALELRPLPRGSWGS